MRGTANQSNATLKVVAKPNSQVTETHATAIDTHFTLLVSTNTAGCLTTRHCPPHGGDGGAAMAVAGGGGEWQWRRQGEG